MIKLFYKNCIVFHKEWTRFDQSFFQNRFFLKSNLIKARSHSTTIKNPKFQVITTWNFGFFNNQLYHYLRLSISFNTRSPSLDDILVYSEVVLMSECPSWSLSKIISPPLRIKSTANECRSLCGLLLLLKNAKVYLLTMFWIALLERGLATPP